MMRCVRCKDVLTPARTGRPRSFCSAACRVAAYRRRRRQSIHFSSRTGEWSTPADLFARLDARFGPFTLDAAAAAENAKCATYYTARDDGLARPWTGRVWCNPPYGRGIGAWVRKAWEAAQTTAEVVILLIPARTDTSWWHAYCACGRVEFLPGRVRFGGAACGAPFPSAVVEFRNAKTVTKLAEEAAG